MKYRIVEVEMKNSFLFDVGQCEELPPLIRYQIQSFRNGAWDVDMRTWNPNSCGYIDSLEKAKTLFNELVYPKLPKVILEVDTND